MQPSQRHGRSFQGLLRPSPPPTCSEGQTSVPSPPGQPPGLPAPAPRSRPLPPLSPRRGTRHRGRQLLRGAWARPAGMPAALLLTMPTGSTAQGLAPVLPGAGEPVPTVLAVVGGVGPASSWRGITVGSQASWATMPPGLPSPSCSCPCPAPGRSRGWEVVGKPQQPRRSPRTAGCRARVQRGWFREEAGCADSSRHPAPAPAGSAGSPVGKSGSGATRARPAELGFKWVCFHQLEQKSVYRESPFPFLLQQTAGASKIRFWSQFQCVCVYVCVRVHMCMCVHAHVCMHV